VLIVFGKCRPPAGVISLAGLCFTVVVGLLIGSVDMGCVIRIHVRYVHKRLNLWTTYFLDVSIVGKPGLEFCDSTDSIT
jgi:hypothetical protein